MPGYSSGVYPYPFIAVDPLDPRRNDLMPESPVDWEDIELGPGQEPGAPLAHLQFTQEGSAIMRTDVRRAPGYESLEVVGRWPESPA